MCIIVCVYMYVYIIVLIFLISLSIDKNSDIICFVQPKSHESKH